MTLTFRRWKFVFFYYLTIAIPVYQAVGEVHFLPAIILKMHGACTVMRNSAVKN
jgi:hypothetical protein